MRKLFTAILLLATFTSSADALTGNEPLYSQQRPQKNHKKEKPQLQVKPIGSASYDRSLPFLVDRVRRQLATLPYYNVFDWLEGEATTSGKVILRGEVVKPITKSEAESRVRGIEGVEQVVNNIEVLPLSPNDDRLRRAVYFAIYNANSPLFRYSNQPVPPIHIIVNHGRAVLKGVVATRADSTIAYIKAREVSGLFEVRNELKVEEM